MDTNRTSLRIVEETENGVIPASPVFMELRNTGAPGFGINPTTIESNEIRPDRQVQDIVTVGAEPGGEVNMELSYGSFDMLFEGAFQKRWNDRASVEGSGITSIASNVITTASAHTVKANDVILLSGFSETKNNGVFTVASVEETTITVNETLSDTSSIPAAATIKVVGVQAAAGDVTATVVETVAGLTSTTYDFTTSGLEAGQWIKIGDADNADVSFTQAKNNGLARVKSVAAHLVEFDFAPEGFAADPGTDKKIRFYMGDFLKNADKIIDATKVDPIISYTIEQSFLDHNPIDYQYISYMIPDTLSMTMSAANFVEMSVNFLGSTAQIATQRLTGAQDKTAPDNPILNTSSNVAQIARGANKIEGANYVNELTVEINNNARRRTAVGIYGTQSIGLGEFGVSGTMSTYFSNAELLTTLINNEETSLNYMLKDNQGHAYLFDMPRVKYSSGNPEVGGKNEDVMLELEYRAIRSPDLGYTLSITRFDYVN